VKNVPSISNITTALVDKMLSISFRRIGMSLKVFIA
jgi:hypothetical protein